MHPNHVDLRWIASLLTAVSGRILQVSDRKASVAMGTAANTIIGASVATSMMGAVGTLGTAGTGAAIAGLTGAAKTTATLYWIGGLVGGGVAAGTVVLGAGALGAGIYGSVKVRRAILGQSRRYRLSNREQQIVLAVHAMIGSIGETIRSGRTVSNRELALFCHLGLSPVLVALETGLVEGAFGELNVYNRARLRGHINNLRNLQDRLEQR